MRDIFRKEIFRLTFELVLNELLKQKVNTEIIEYLNMLMFYIKSASQIRYNEAEEVINDYKKRGNKNMETIFDIYAKQSLKKGIKKGIEKGIKIGNLLTALTQLVNRNF